MTISAVTKPPGLQCDDCGLVVVQPNRLNDMRGWAAQEHRWVRRDDEDFCPLCAEAASVVERGSELNRRAAPELLVAVRQSLKDFPDPTAA